MKLSTAFQHALNPGPLSDPVLRRSVPRGGAKWPSWKIAWEWRARYWAARRAALPAATLYALENYRAWRKEVLNGK